jgi:hypothetical protein
VTFFEIVFQSDTNKIGLAYLQTLCNLCDGGDNKNRFFGPRIPRSGGPDLKFFFFDRNSSGFFSGHFRTAAPNASETCKRGI